MSDKFIHDENSIHPVEQAAEQIHSQFYDDVNAYLDDVANQKALAATTIEVNRRLETLRSKILSSVEKGKVHHVQTNRPQILKIDTMSERTAVTVVTPTSIT